MVEMRAVSGTDPYGHPTYESTWEEVRDVLVCPTTGEVAARTLENRESETRSSFTIHFPKGWYRPLRGLKVRLRGRLFNVIGEPDHFTLENTPGRWWMPVSVVEVDG